MILWMSDYDMRIMITKLWSDRNTGDSAIGIATAQLLRRSFPNSKLYGMSYFGANQNDLVQSESFTIRNYVHSVVGGLFPTYASYKPRNRLCTRMRARLLTYLSFVFALAVLFIIRIEWFTKISLGKFRKSLELFKKSDVIVVKGGSHIHGGQGLGSCLYLFKELYPAILAIVLKKPYLLLGHSIWDIDKTPSKCLFRFIAKRATLITVREENSFENLKKIGVTENAKVMPDLSFFIRIGEQKSSSPGRARARRKLRVGITVRCWGTPQYRYRYLSCMTEFIEFLVHEYKATVLIIPHTRGPTTFEEDLLESRRLHHLVQRQGLAEVFLVDEDLSMNSLLDLYSSLDILVGTRFHSVIFALLLGVPAIAISYESPKAYGIMKMLDLERFCIDISNIKLKDLVQRFADLERSSPLIRSQIESFLSELSNELKIYENLLRKACA